MSNRPGPAHALFDRDRLKRILDGVEDAAPNEAQVLVRIAAAIAVYGNSASVARAEALRALADRIPYDTALDLCRCHIGGLDSKTVPQLRHAVEDILERWRANAYATPDEYDSTPANDDRRHDDD
jgi:hypothetical protein